MRRSLVLPLLLVAACGQSRGDIGCDRPYEARNQADTACKEPVLPRLPRG